MPCLDLSHIDKEQVAIKRLVLSQWFDQWQQDRKCVQKFLCTLPQDIRTYGGQTRSRSSSNSASPTEASTYNRSSIQICMLWMSINLTANNITLGMLSPTILFPSFLGSALCNVLGMLVECLPVAHVATFGPRSVNRTMLFIQFAMG